MRAARAILQIDDPEAPAKAHAPGSPVIGLDVEQAMGRSIASGARHRVRKACLGCACALGLCAPAAAGDEAPPLLLAMNVSINHAVAYVDDRAASGRLDDWATPDELAARGGGDCEDVAIAKYFRLRRAGIPAGQLRIAYVELQAADGGRRQRHMVLAWLPPGEAPGDELVLDNLLDAVRPLSERSDLRVLISFNSEGIWPGLARGLPARGPRQITRWAQVLDRVGPVP